MLAFSDADLDLCKLLFSGLLRYNQDQTLIPDLAERYEISEDQKKYTFTLKAGLAWQDGDGLNADDILFTFQTIQDPQYKSPLRKNFQGVSVEKKDDLTVQFTLQEPLAPFLGNLTTGILPSHLWREVPPESFALTDLNIKPIRAGNGPFQFESLVKTKSGDIKSYTIKRSEKYHDHKPYIDKIIFKFYPDLTSAFDTIKSNNTEGMSFVPRNMKEELVKFNKKISYYSLRLPQYTAIFFNQKNTILRDKKIREALAYSIDREKILKEALKNEGEIIHGPILPGYIGYNPDLKKFGFDSSQASTLLDQAGWAKNPDNEYRKKADQELTFSLTTVNLPEYEKTASILQENWKSIGVKLDIKVLDTASIKKDAIKNRNYDALLFGEIVGNDPDPYPFWHSSQTEEPGQNLAIFYNKTIDQLLEEARKINNPEQRRIKYLHFQNLLIEEELPAIFLYNPSYIYGITKKINGVSSSYITTPSDRFVNITNWYVKTKREWKKK